MTVRPLAWLCALGCLGCGPKVGVDPSDDGGASHGGDVTTAGPDSATTAVPSGAGSTPGATGDGTTGNSGMPQKFDVMLPTSDTGECQPWASQGCSLEQPGFSLVHGHTPLGEVLPEGHAFFSGAAWCDGCVETVRIDRVFLVADPGLMKDVNASTSVLDGLELQLQDFEGPLDEELEGLLIHFREGEQASTQATFTMHQFPAPEDLGEPFDPDEPAVITGTLATTAEDWSLHGDFFATYCPQANAYAICE